MQVKDKKRDHTSMLTHAQQGLHSCRTSFDANLGLFCRPKLFNGNLRNLFTQWDSKAIDFSFKQRIKRGDTGKS